LPIELRMSGLKKLRMRRDWVAGRAQRQEC
jgi:hypothetical protein